MNPLNPSLYNALVRVFKHVGITNPLQRASVRHYPDWQREGRLEVDVREGERYRVSCPFCSDTRQRLYISHVWGTRDDKTGREILYPVICFNEDCVNNRQRQEELRDMVFTFSWGIGPHLSQVTDTSSSKRVVRRGPLRLPGPLTPISSVKHARDAREYLQQRGFNPDDLA